MAEMKIGMIGLDTSHVVAFAKCFNDTRHSEHIPGARITVAFPGGSPDFDLSWNRMPGFTKQLHEEFGVEMVDSPEAVAEQVDLVFIMSVDGRAHREQFARTIRFKRPTFIDKPLATSLADAQEIFHLARQANIPVMSCSSLRYADPLHAALALDDPEIGNIVGCDVFGPMAIQPTQPGLFWYGIHCVEIVNRVMGRGCVEVKATANEHGDVIACVFNDGRMASIRGLRKGHSKFGLTLHREKAFQCVDCATGKKSWYASMLDAVMKSLPQGKSDVPPEDTLEIVRLIEAANESRRSGQAVKL